MTLIRWTDKLNKEQKDKFINWCYENENVLFECIKYKVTKIHIVEASWCMRNGEFKIFDEINF